MGICKCGAEVWIKKSQECRKCYRNRYNAEHNYWKDQCPTCNDTKHKASTQCVTCYKSSLNPMSPEERKAKQHDWYMSAKGTPAYKARKRAGKAKYPDPTKLAHKQRRRALQCGVSVDVLPTNLMNSLMGFYGSHCMKCNAEGVTLDHVTPISKGGSHSLINFQLLCMKCNRQKGVDDTDYRSGPVWVDRLV